MIMFAGVVPEKVLSALGAIYAGRPLAIKTRKELLETIRPSQWRFLREDTGDIPRGPSKAALPRIIMARPA
jgi:hypothetical protein